MKSTPLLVMVCVAILPDLGWTMAVKPACPIADCTCSEGEGLKSQTRSEMAICKQIPKQRLPTSITSLTVTGDIRHLTKQMMSTVNNNLEMLDLSNCKITTIDAGSFDKLTSLVTLKLSGNMLQTLARGTFKMNTKLKELYLNGNRFTQMDSSTFTKLTNLRDLYLEDNQLMKIPNKLPQGLMKLIMSNNKLGPEIDSANLQQVKLKELDLCNNPITKLSLKFFMDISEVQELHLGDRVVLPRGCAKQLKHITSMELAGAAGNVIAQLDRESQREIGEMTHLNSLRIANYKIETLSFLEKLSQLSTLRLQNVIVTRQVDLQRVLSENQYLRDVIFDNSPELAANLLENFHLLSMHHSLRTISLKNAGVTHVALFNVPNVHFRLDISENPLTCDCTFEWLKPQASSLDQVLHSIDKTICHSPAESHGLLLSEALHTLQCPSEREFVHGHEEDTWGHQDQGHHGTESQGGFSEDPEWTGGFDSITTAHTMEPGHNEDGDSNMGTTPVYNGDGNTNGGTPSIDKGEDNFNGGMPPVDNGEDNTNGGTPTIDNGEDNTNGGMPPVDNGEDNTNGGTPPIDNGEDNFNGGMPPVDNGEDNTNGGMPPVDNGEDNTNGEMPPVDNGDDNTHEGTPPVDNGEDNFNGDHNNNQGASTHNDAHVGNPHPTEPSHKPNTDSHVDSRTPTDDDSPDVLYIALGSVLLALIIVGIVLIAILWRVKKGSSKIEPASTDAQQVQPMPSFKNLQAKEDTGLISGAKK